MEKQWKKAQDHLESIQDTTNKWRKVQTFALQYFCLESLQHRQTLMSKTKNKKHSNSKGMFSAHSMKMQLLTQHSLTTYLSLEDMSSAGPFRNMLALALWTRWGFSSTCLAKAAFGFLADRFIRSSSMLMSFSESCARRTIFQTVWFGDDLI